ncbi:metalloendoproteinase 5-MMP-like [Bidens hawaiensis]|uniref:metalloendoproteinase 5-MMP-like n=1 Tax=Bidens hawaiensis TaxID=980011 RepID=UPI00404AF9C0
MASKLIAFLPILFTLFSLSNAMFNVNTIKSLQGCHKGTKVPGLHNLKLYLARFGYLNYQHTPNNVNPGLDEFDQELETALKSYQNFNHLNASGTLDEPTVSRMLMPRCGVPDHVNSSHTHEVKLLSFVSRYQFFPGNPRWYKNHLTYAFHSKFPNAFVPPVVRAFNQWASASRYFTFSRSYHIISSNIKITLEHGNHGDGDFTNVLAHSTPPTYGLSHYNAKFNFSVGPGPVLGAYDLESVAVHEIGHLLGLDHSQDQSSIMWPYEAIGTVKGLNSDDIQGIRTLYGTNK